MYYLCSENKSADQVIAQLICPFVLAYAKRRFSYDAAHIYTLKIIYFALTNAMIDILKQLNSLSIETNADTASSQTAKQRYFCLMGETVLSLSVIKAE